MANFLEGIGNILMHPIDEAKFLWKEGVEDVGKNLIRGDFGEAWDQVKEIPGAHNRMMSENIAVPLGGHNKITENPDAVAGAVVGSVLAAPMVMGALGSTGTSSAFSLGDVGNYFKPGGKLNQVWQNVTGPSDDVLGALADAESYGDVIDDTFLGNLADAEANGAFDQKWGAEAAGLGKGEDALNSLDKPFDFDKMAKVLKSIEIPEEENIEMASHRLGGGGVRFDPNLYENPLVAREFKDMYSQPLYKSLV